jgi:hypothetical protein
VKNGLSFYFFFFFFGGGRRFGVLSGDIYLGTYMREHKPRIKGCNQVDIFLCDIFVYIFFVDIKKYRPGRDHADIFYTRL